MGSKCREVPLDAGLGMHHRHSGRSRGEVLNRGREFPVASQPRSPTTEPRRRSTSQYLSCSVLAVLISVAGLYIAQEMVQQAIGAWRGHGIAKQELRRLLATAAHRIRGCD